MYQKKILYLTPEAHSSLARRLAKCFSDLNEYLHSERIRPIHVLKQTVFLKVTQNQEFKKKSQEILGFLQEFYQADLPPTTFVGQAPEGNNDFAIELLILLDHENQARISRKEYLGFTYSVVEYPQLREIYAGGLTADDLSLSRLDQAKSSFAAMEGLLLAEDLTFSDVVRQWNYIEDITGFSSFDDSSRQNYQIFNDVRSLYYGPTDFGAGFPAATGIGMNTGGVVLEFIALTTADNNQILPLRNPGQVDAHQYAAEYLIGNHIKELKQKTTPKFERAKVVARDKSLFIYISGTAAIKGQEVRAENDIAGQTRITIENILNLISPENLKAHGLVRANNRNPLSYLRVYVKTKADIPVVKEICEEYFGQPPALYLVSDICRETLLVEIEGALEYNFL